MARRSNRKQPGAWNRFFVALQLIWIATCLVGAGAILFVGFRLKPILSSLPSVADADRDVGNATTIVYAADKDPATGNLFELGRVSDRFQETVPMDRIPQALRDATVAIEDERFYSHSGIDPWGIVRALVRNVQVQRLSEGASTITQQLVRNILLTRRKTLDRKLQEAVLALQMERTLTKDRILEKYLNEVNYGGNIYGVGAATKYYFGKDIADLTVSECALLAGLPQRPSATDPFRHPDAALRRRDVVLAKMRELGFLDTRQEAVETSRKIVFLKKAPARSVRFRAPHFTNWVLRGLVKRHGKDIVYRGGLRVYTTLHWQLQQQAEQVLREGVEKASDSGVTEGALVAMDPRNGHIIAMVGSTDYDKVEYNYTTGKSQPGSTFKPFVYAAAFETGKYTPDNAMVDSPVTIGDWSPRNYGGRFSYSSMSLRSAVALSKNTIPVKLAREIGIGKVIDCARRLGIESPLNRDLTLALGTCQVSPLEMNTAYCAFANGGNRVEPSGLFRVLDPAGESLEAAGTNIRKAALAETAVKRVDECLEAVVDYGTAAGARDVRAVGDARGKTGTTSDNKDAWFIGYVPEVVATVYVNGVERVVRNGKVIVRYKPMEGVTGGRVCAPIWGRFVRQALPILQREREGDPFAGLRVGIEATNAVSNTDIRPAPGQIAPNATPVASPASPALPPATEPGQSDSGLQPALESPPPVGQNEESWRLTGAAATLSSPRTTVDRFPQADVSVNVRPAPSVVRPSAPVAPSLPRFQPPPETMVDTLVCADSGALANDYCPEALRRRLPPARVPKRPCKQHGPRPDER